MGLFNIFKNKKEDYSEAIEDYNNALNTYDEKNYQEALGTLSWGFKKDINYKPLYKLAFKCLTNLGGNDEAKLFENALNNFHEFESFNNLGAHFYNEERYDLALPFLEKAVSIDSSNNDTVHDLSIVYARRFQIDKAIEVLEKDGPKNDFWNFWFWCKLSILSENTTGVKEGLNELSEILDKEPNQEDILVPRQKVNEVIEMLNRYNLVKNRRQHIQDWHFIQYGNVILDFFEDTEDYVAGGRYVATWSSNESIKEINNLLKIYLESFDLKFQKVKYLDDRDSEIIGIAIGKELNLDSSCYFSNENNENCLIVGANSFNFNNYYELAEVKNGQILYALNHDWLSSSSISPDIVGLMSQSYYFPWNGGGFKIIDAEKGLTEQTEPDNRNSNEIASDIFKNEPYSEVEKDKLDFYLKNKEYIKGIGSKTNNHRFNFMIESPVPGSHFG